MNQAQHIIPRLKKLIELEKTQASLRSKKDASAVIAAEIDALRAVLPTSILRHHDMRRDRGKLSLVPVSGRVCGACHLAVPVGRLADLKRVAESLNLCDHCGVFIYLADDTQLEPAQTRKKAMSKSAKVVRAKGPARSSLPCGETVVRAN